MIYVITTQGQGAHLIKGPFLYKSPLKNVVKIAPNIYIIDIGGYFNKIFEGLFGTYSP